jgi:adenine-specific DNA-methyltransferase
LADYASVLSDAGAIFVSNDENEYAKLRHMLNELFGAQFIENLVWRKKSGGGQTDEYFVTEHDYITCYAKKKGVFSIREKTLEKSTEGYPLFDEKKRKRYKRVKLAKWGTGAHKEDRPTMYFPLESPDGEECYPVAPDGRPGRWRYGKTAVIQMVENGDIDWVKNEDSWIPYEKVYEPEKGDLSILKERSILYDLVENAAGSNELKALFGIKDVFPNPKPSDLIHHLSMLVTNPDGEIVLDFFAGSGTTAHAVINLNREDGGRRKYILVEMGDYFETVLLPRIKKVVYSDNWKDGKPQKGKGISHFVKYLYLEQYEDTLNNLDLTTRKQEGQLALERFGDEYLLRYMLKFETQGSPSLLNLEQFQDPFNYKLKVQEGDEIREHVVDLVETFNYLLGIHVKKMRQFQDNGRLYRAVLGEKHGERIVIVWRPLEGLLCDSKDVRRDQGSSGDPGDAQRDKDSKGDTPALRRDRKFIECIVLPALLGKGKKPDRLLVNGIRYGPGAESIETEFKRLMWRENQDGWEV